MSTDAKCHDCGVYVAPSPCFCGTPHTPTKCWPCHHKEGRCAAPHCPEHGFLAAQKWMAENAPSPATAEPTREGAPAVSYGAGGGPSTHRCKVCDARWRLNPDGTWSLVSRTACACCDNVPMREQIEPMPKASEEEKGRLEGEVSTNTLTPDEIKFAAAEGRLRVDADGFGWVSTGRSPPSGRTTT